MESINGWIKTELFTDFHITGEKSVADEIADYIKFFNEERPAYSLNYLTPLRLNSSEICIILALILSEFLFLLYKSSFFLSSFY